MKTIRIIVLALLTIIIITGCKKKDDVIVQLQQGSATSYGRLNIEGYEPIDFRIFDNLCPDAVSIVKEDVNNKAYQNIEISQIINEYCIVINADTKSAAQTDKKPTEEEKELYPIYGAVCIPNDSSEPHSIMIICSDAKFISELEELLNYKGVTLKDYILYAYGYDISESELNIYRENGGAPWLKEHYTVIGQVYNGAEALNKLIDSPSDEHYVPLTPIILNNFEIK